MKTYSCILLQIKVVVVYHLALFDLLTANENNRKNNLIVPTVISTLLEEKKSA